MWNEWCLSEKREDGPRARAPACWREGTPRAHSPLHFHPSPLTCRRQHVLDKHEHRLLGRDLDALADDVHELADREVRGDEVLGLVDVRDGGFVRLFDDDLVLSGEGGERGRGRVW